MPLNPRPSGPQPKSSGATTAKPVQHRVEYGHKTPTSNQLAVLQKVKADIENDSSFVLNALKGLYANNQFATLVQEGGLFTRTTKDQSLKLAYRQEFDGSIITNPILSWAGFPSDTGIGEHVQICDLEGTAELRNQPGLLLSRFSLDVNGNMYQNQEANLDKLAHLLLKESIPSYRTGASFVDHACL